MDFDDGKYVSGKRTHFELTFRQYRPLGRSSPRDRSDGSLSFFPSTVEREREKERIVRNFRRRRPGGEHPEDIVRVSCRARVVRIDAHKYDGRHLNHSLLDLKSQLLVRRLCGSYDGFSTVRVSVEQCAIASGAWYSTFNNSNRRYLYFTTTPFH